MNVRRDSTSPERGHQVPSLGDEVASVGSNQASQAKLNVHIVSDF